MNITQEFFKISITGDLGSGKSTVANLISDKLQFNVYSTGQAQRKLAAKYNMTTLQLNEYSKTHPEVDKEIDSIFVNLGNADENVIFDSRLAWHFVPNSFKVYLSVDSNIAAQRIIDANRGKTETYLNLEDARHKILERKRCENERYLSIYNVYCDRMSNYDLIVDTSHSDPESIANFIIKKFQSWSKKEYFNKLWISPRLPFPTQNIRNIEQDLVNTIRCRIKEFGFDERIPIEVLYVDNYFYIYDGHNRTAASLLAGLTLIPVRVVAEEDQPLYMGLKAIEYVKTNCSLSWIHDWEDAFHVRFNNYPELNLIGGI